MTADADQLELGQGRGTPVEPLRVRVRHAELGFAQSGRDVRMGACIDVGVDAQRDRRAAREADLLAILSAGAYGMVMSSNYNSRPRAAEVLVAGAEAHLVRRRESVEELFAAERIPG